MNNLDRKSRSYDTEIINEIQVVSQVMEEKESSFFPSGL